MTKVTVKELQDFEKEIADIYATGLIKAPVHLRSGNEEQLIEIFNRFDINRNDYIFGYWDSHFISLLKGVPREDVKAQILAGNSIALCFPEYKVLCSGIVGSLVGVATGTAWELKRSGKQGKVYHFCGEMSAETGIFYEAAKYAYNFDLPITFVVCDNGLSVMTDTRKTWGNAEPWFNPNSCYTNIVYFKYTNGYPHSGLGKLIKF